MLKRGHCRLLPPFFAVGVAAWGCGESKDDGSSEVAVPAPAGVTSSPEPVSGSASGANAPTLPSDGASGDSGQGTPASVPAAEPPEGTTPSAASPPTPAADDTGEASPADASPAAEPTSEEGAAGAAGESVGAGGAGEGAEEPSVQAPTTEGCSSGPWETADPSMTGPFEVATDNEVGPEAGDPEEDGTVPRFTMFRPADIEQSELCHPVITWGNGTGSTPNLYGAFLRHFASHGFVVIGSNSTNVSRGDPKPMNVGIDWVLEQNEDPSSVLYQRIDTAHIGATGHSQGAAATTQASGDQRIVASVPIEGAGPQRDLNGPAMFFCGGMDDVVSCDGAQRALDAVTTLPAMYANYLTATHGNWLSRGGDQRSDVETAVTAWMRVHLMQDEALRSWFYGDSCQLCTDTAWEVDRKNMDE